MMKKILNRIAVHSLVAFAISILLMAPAYLFQFFCDKPILWFRLKYLWVFMAFGAVLGLCRSLKLIGATLVFLGLLEITQFGSLAYSGDYLIPYTVEFMLLEFSEVIHFTQLDFFHFFYVPVVVLLPYTLIFLCLLYSRQFRFTVKWAPVLVILFLLFPAARVKLHIDRHDIMIFFPTTDNPTLVNTLNTYAVLGAKILPDRFFHTPSRTFKPYIIKEIPDDGAPRTVVLIMGESMTPNHMSLFGYERPNTPFLDSMASDPSFAFKKGYSSATSTRSTFPMFFTVQYHPENIYNLSHQQANLFYLAKTHGFHTIYISAQKSNCLNGIKISHIDTLVTYEDEKALFDTKKDDGLLELIKQFDLGPRNFIVIHQRNIHDPYWINYGHHPELEIYPVEGLSLGEFKINTYDNGMLYNDILYRQLFAFLLQQSRPPLYLWITSDHGEALGEEGLWGHDRLNFNSATVPILFYEKGGDVEYIRRFDALHIPTHYEMGKIIAEQLGYEIINPNEEKDIFYIQGIVGLSKGGYLKCHRNINTASIQSEFVR